MAELNENINPEETEAKELVKTDEQAEMLKTALVFGQSEDDLRREFKEFKALKLFRKLIFDLTASRDRDEFDGKIADAISYGFGGVLVFPTDIKRAKEKIGKADIEVIAAVCYPFGEDGAGVKKLAVKRVSTAGAGGVLLAVGVNAIKSGNTDFIRREIKRCLKVNKTLKLTAVIESGEMNAEEIERVTRMLSAIGVKSFCGGTGFCKRGDGTEYKIMRSFIKTDCELIAFDKSGKSDVTGLLQIVDRVVTADGEKVVGEIRSRLALGSGSAG